MPVIARDFSGSLDLDSHPFKVGPKNYIDALNICHNSQGQSSDGVISNIVGNQPVVFEQPAGTNVCIGSFADKKRNLVYEFVYNSNGNHRISFYDRSTGIKTKIIESITDTNGSDILKFSLNNRVDDVFIIHRDGQGDILLFNDGLNKPGCFNVDWIRSLISATNPIPETSIRLAKVPPLDAIFAVYQSDATLSVNNFKKKLFQFKYRWVNKDGFKSTWSPSSKVKIPLDAYTVDVESDPTKNNVINIQVKGGGLDFFSVEIAGRYSIGATFCDWFLIDTLGSADYNISIGGTYNYRFLNDGAYPALDQRESDLLFDYVPDVANAMALINGNVVALAGITDGYDPLNRSAVNVQITSYLVDTGSSTSTPATPKITYTSGVSGGKKYTAFVIDPSVSEGCVFNIKFHHPIYKGDDYYVDVTYIANSTDTSANVAEQLSALIAADMTGHPASCVYDPLFPNKVNAVNEQQPPPNSYPFDEIITSTSAVILKAGGSPTWLWNTKYRMGLLYFDQYGKTNGVVSFVSNSEDPNDFSVTTPNFAVAASGTTTVGQPRVPVISASISHLPPSWAVRFQWVRTPNLSVESFLHYMTAQVDDETPYQYLCIANLDQYKLDNSGFIPSYVFQSGDRVRMMAGFVANASPLPDTVTPYTQDYEILGVVTRPVGPPPPVTVPVTPQTTGRFLKIAKQPGVTFNPHTMIQIYRPALRTSSTTQVFYEFGESYPIYVNGGIRYHVGQNQNQTSAQPATFVFKDGDVYYKFRNFYTNTLVPADIYSEGVMDANYSDSFESAVNSNGRPNVIDSNAKRLYNPVQLSFGQSFEPGTNVNGLNRFYPTDFDEYSRDFGDIMKLSVRDRIMRVFQKLKVGGVPVLRQMTYNVDNSSNLILSSNLINKIDYFAGNYGIGDCPESLVSNNYADYWYDNIRGTFLRLSQDGIVSLSPRHGLSAFSVIQKEGRAHGVIGAFDEYNNLYIATLKATGSLPAKTIVWNEAQNGFETFLSYIPEQLTCLNNLMIAWKDGVLYTHDNPLYNNFFGVQYESSITGVFNDVMPIKKTFRKIMIESGEVWDVPEFSTNINSYGSTKQSTVIVPEVFELNEGDFHAAVPNDANSQGGRIGGAPMNGKYAILKIRRTDTSAFVFLNQVILSDNLSPKNPLNT